MILAQNQKPFVSIYLSKEQLSDRNSTALYAAKELRYYLDRITCASFKIEEAQSHASGIYIGEAANICTDDLGEDGFHIVTEEDRLCIVGGTRGVIYGVYEFLESL